MKKKLHNIKYKCEVKCYHNIKCNKINSKINKIKANRKSLQTLFYIPRSKGRSLSKSIGPSGLVRISATFISVGTCSK